MKKDPLKKPTDQKTPEASTRATDDKQRSESQHSRPDAASPPDLAQAQRPQEGPGGAQMEAAQPRQESAAQEDAVMHDEIE